MALVPLFIACEGVAPLSAAGLGFVTGVAANYGIFWWLFEVSAFRAHHSVIIGAYLGLYPAVWCVGMCLFRRARLPLILTAPALWMALDYLHANAGFMALPWGTLAHTQHQNLAVLQVAALAGEYGVTFLVALGNAAVAAIILQRAWRSAAIAALVLALAHGGGALALFLERPGPTLRVAAVQPNISNQQRSTPQGRAATLDRLERLTRAAARSRPALIVWPETAVAAANLQANPPLAMRLQELARAVQEPIVLGASEVEKFAFRDQSGSARVRGYNSAYLLVPGGPLGTPYHKRALVPFGEYAPLQKVIHWPAWLVQPTFETVPGDSPHLFRLPGGTPFGTLICWENLFAGLARESVQAGARLLVQLTNDAWFGRTAAPRQHNIASVLRGVENRVPIVIASNAGPSQIIDPHGRVLASGPDVFTEGNIVAEVRLGTGGTLYTHVGDLFAFAVIAALALAVLRQVLPGRMPQDAGHPRTVPEAASAFGSGTRGGELARATRRRKQPSAARGQVYESNKALPTRKGGVQ